MNELKKPAYIIAAVITLIGVVAVAVPDIAGLGIAYLITAGFFIYGILKVITWANTPKEIRSGFFLADGVISALLGGMILFDALKGPVGQVEMLVTISLTAGFLSVFNGISMTASYKKKKKNGFGLTGFFLAGGILRLLLGIMIIMNPIAGWFTLQWSWGILFIITGIALLFEIRDLPL